MYRVVQLVVLVLCLAASLSEANAEQTVVSDDGREVKLLEDGSWKYISEDRFATTSDGKRIRLKADGSWLEVEDDRGWISVPAQSLQRSRDVATVEGYKLELVDVRIESVRTRQQKNTRLRSQIVAVMKVSGPGLDDLKLDTSGFTVTDSKGRVYPAAALTIRSPASQEDSPAVIELIAEGSPRWWGVKFLRLQIMAGILGPAEVELTKAMDDVARLEVEALTVL